MSASTRWCTTCGAPLLEGGDRLCPACLLRLAIETGSIADSTGLGSAGTAGSADPLAGDAAAISATAPVRIGRYRILRELGHGGMGVVYLAEQEQPLRREVAIKIIKPGLASPEILARFDAERQALARMDHPGIATVFDAGVTEDGRPYFVMEYVAGLPITKYCDRHRVSTRARLLLVADVCGALQHAHQKGLIHRDIKPSNVLVSGDAPPTPKVIDFGVAKATEHVLTERTLFTGHGQMIGTPGYMSPEQADSAAIDIDIRTDIYSLGVLLYELLVGAAPFDAAQLRRAGYAEIQRIIREDEPARPSTRLSSFGRKASDVAFQRRTTLPTLARELRGDLDWIALKALDKDRRRRYASAAAFADDIRRYLDDEPVVARPPSVAYRSQKFVRRHTWPVAAAASLLITLGAALAVISRLYVQADRARQDADRQRDVATAASAEAVQRGLDAEHQRGTAEAERRRAEEQRDESAFQNYRASLLAAELSLQIGDAETAERRLDATEPSLRGWEWRYLRRVVDAGIRISPNGLTAGRGLGGAGLVFAGDELIEWATNGIARLARREGRASTATSIARPPAGAVSAAGVSMGHFVGISPSGRYAVSVLWNGGLPDCAAEALGTPAAGVTCRETARLAAGAAFSDDVRDAVVVTESATGREVAMLSNPNSGVWTAVEAAPLPADPRRFMDAGTARDAGQEYGFSRLRVAFSPDESRVATWSRNNVIYVSDLRTRASLAVLRGHERYLKAVSFLGNDRIASVSADGTVRIWSVLSGAATDTFTVPGVDSLAADERSGRVAAGLADGTIRVWPIDRAMPTPLVLRAGADRIYAVAFSGDGARLITVSADRSVRVWNPVSGRELLSFTLPVQVRQAVLPSWSLAVDRRGDQVAIGLSDGSIGVWNTSRIGTILAGHERPPDVQFTSSGLVSMARDGTLRTWNVTTGEETRRSILLSDRNTLALAVTANGAQAAVVSMITDAGPVPRAITDIAGQLVDLRSGAAVPLEQRHLAQIVPALAVTPDGTHLVETATNLATSESFVQFWRLPSGRPAGTWHTPLAVSAIWIAFSPDSRRVATSGHLQAAPGPPSPASTGRILIGEIGTDGPRLIIPWTADVEPSLAFMPDGRQLLATGLSGIHVLDTETGADLGTFDGPAGASVCISRDGTRVVTGYRDGIRIWDARRRVLLLTLPLPGKRSASSVAISADGRRIAVGANDGAIFVFDAGTP